MTSWLFKLICRALSATSNKIWRASFYRLWEGRNQRNRLKITNIHFFQKYVWFSRIFFDFELSTHIQNVWDSTIVFWSCSSNRSETQLVLVPNSENKKQHSSKGAHWCHFFYSRKVEAWKKSYVSKMFPYFPVFSEIFWWWIRGPRVDLWLIFDWF